MRKAPQSPAEATCLVYDHGLFVSFAQTLSRSFKRVLYYNSWENAFPTTATMRIGCGLEGVESVDDIWQNFNETDLFIFLDIYDGHLQLALEAMGKLVWGSRKGEELECFRGPSKKRLHAAGLDVGKYKEITGMKALRAHLKSHDDQFVKLSRTRGDAETFFAKNYNSIEPRLDKMAHKLGPHQEYMQFICEDKIEDAVEFAYDGYTVDGQFPNKACYGIEAKSRGYLGHFVDYNKLPQQLQDMNAAMAPTLAQYQYRNFFAMEARVTEDGTPHVIDPCMRAGSPPSEMLQELYTNIADIFWYGAQGVCIDPEPVGEYGAELMITSKSAEDDWLPVMFPPEIGQYVKLRNHCEVDGKTYISPGMDSIGAVVATGKTPKEAKEKCKEYAKKIEGYQVETEPEAFDEIDGEIEKLAKIGIKF